MVKSIFCNASMLSFCNNDIRISQIRASSPAFPKPANALCEQGLGQATAKLPPSSVWIKVLKHVLFCALLDFEVFQGGHWQVPWNSGTRAPVWGCRVTWKCTHLQTHLQLTQAYEERGGMKLKLHFQPSSTMPEGGTRSMLAASFEFVLLNMRWRGSVSEQVSKACFRHCRRELRLCWAAHNEKLHRWNRNASSDAL